MICSDLRCSGRSSQTASVVAEASGTSHAGALLCIMSVRCALVLRCSIGLSQLHGFYVTCMLNNLRRTVFFVTLTDVQCS